MEKKPQVKKTIPAKQVKKSKMDMIKEHLIKLKTITTWEAIKLYNETRLAAKICILRNKRSWVITDAWFESNDGRFKKYFYRGHPKK
jgi:uncharacterized sporulation protein YeaH/YhbH (DUF444 family)